MTTFHGTFSVQVSADLEDEARRILDGIGKRASGHPCAEVVLVSPVEKSPIRKPREEANHA